MTGNKPPPGELFLVTRRGRFCWAADHAARRRTSGYNEVTDREGGYARLPAAAKTLYFPR